MATNKSDHRYWSNPFHNKAAEISVFYAVVEEVKNALRAISAKYGDKIRDMKRIEEENSNGFRQFQIEPLINEYIQKDPDLSEAILRARRAKLGIKGQVAKAFKELFIEALDEDYFDGKTGTVKTKKRAITDKIVDDMLNDRITNETINAFKTIRDSIGEKPVEEIITKGLEAKVIDINITQDKVNRVKELLDGIKKGGVLGGLQQNIEVGAGNERPGNERVVEAGVSGESERVYLPDVVSDKQG